MFCIPESKENKNPNTREIDVLDEVDITLYGPNTELNENQKNTVRDMVAVMRMRQAQHDSHQPSDKK